MALKKKDHTASGATIAGAGATTAGVGVLGGGVPGAKSNASSLAAWKASGSGEGVRGHVSTARAKAPAVKAAPGGVFGYRTSAHQGFNTEVKADEARHAGTTTSRANHFQRGRHWGKVKPEEQIIRHLKVGRAGATAALVGGSAATVAGVRRAQGKDWRGNVKKSQKDTDKLHGTLLGVGAAGAATSAGGARLLERQGRKWSHRSASNLSGAQKIVPNMGGYTSAPHPKGNPRVPDVAPHVGDTKIGNDKKILAGKSKVQAENAGRLRGEATQARYFAGVYGKTAMQARRATKPALAAAGLGAAGLALSRKKDKVRKNSRMSAFGVEH